MFSCVLVVPDLVTNVLIVAQDHVCHRRERPVRGQPTLQEVQQKRAGPKVSCAPRRPADGAQDRVAQEHSGVATRDVEPTRKPPAARAGQDSKVPAGFEGMFHEGEKFWDQAKR